MIRHLMHCATALTLIVVLANNAPATSYYTEGHAGMGLGEGEELELHVHAHAGTIVDGVPLPEDHEYAPGELVIVVPESTKDYVRAGGGATAYVAGPLGLAEGDDYWFIPETDSLAAPLHAPFFGMSAEGLSGGLFDGEAVDVQLIAMNGPSGGQFGLETFDNGWFMATADGITGADGIEGFPVGGHAHFNWYFTEPGTYQLTFQVSGTVGGSPVSDTGTFTFQVIPEPGVLALLASGLGAGLMALLFRRARR